MPKRSPDRVDLFPCFARLDPPTSDWQILLHGRVMLPRPDGFKRRFIDRFYRRAFRISATDANSPIYRKRIEGFLDASRHGVRMALHLPYRSLMLRRRTAANGHFRCVIRARREDLLRDPIPHAPERWIPVQVANIVSGTSAKGQVRLIPHHGVSVISDIDDTIRFSYVGQRRRLIESTFLHPFQAVEGMARLYHRWEELGAAFHYVSSSPWQLYGPLSEFLLEAGFPLGTFHLRSMRWRDPSILQLWIAKKHSKVRAIRMLLKWYPDRQFLLVGDSVERDPEIYGAAARRFPDQVVGIFIRQVPGSNLSVQRWHRAFAEIPPTKWQLFQDPSQIPPLHELAVLADKPLTTA